MKKYLGSTITAFAAVVMPLFVCSPISFAVSMLCAEISGATVFLACGCAACSLICGIWLHGICDQLYSWGTFTCDGVRITNGFTRGSTIEYDKCKSCGIAFYVHSGLHTKAGTKIWFIYLSCDYFDESYRSTMNLWKPSPTRIKVQFSKELYDYLLIVLPPKQSKMLARDYRRYFG